jgi:hypothetical protein
MIASLLMSAALGQCANGQCAAPARPVTQAVIYRQPTYTIYRSAPLPRRKAQPCYEVGRTLFTPIRVFHAGCR